MSESLTDFDSWPTQIASARIPANNNVRRMEVLVNPVLSATTAAQPGSPNERDVYIIPAGATGSNWGSFDEGDIAIFYEATWTAFAPYEGLRKFVSDEGEDWQYIGDSSGGWGPAGGGGGGAVSSVNGNTGAVTVQAPIGVACSDLTTDLTTGTKKGYFRAPYAMENLTFRSSLIDSSSSGLVTVDINKNGSTILSTKLSIDSGELTSTTAATPYVATSTTCADDDLYEIDIDAAGTDAKGLIVWFIGNAS